MAASPAHKWGQIIGHFIENAFEAELSKFARRHSLYLDKKGTRPARPGKKVRWVDLFGNTHDLDAENVQEAMTFIQQYKNDGQSLPVLKYEITIRYNNGDKIEASFTGTSPALSFLAAYGIAKS